MQVMYNYAGVAGKRTYLDGCAIAYALDVIGERWALLIVRELLYRPRRFTELGEVLTGISTNSLTQRLRELEEHGILVHRQLPPPAETWVYELTPFGRTLEPVLMVLGQWGSTLPNQRAGQPMSVASLIGALRTHFSPERANGQPFAVGLILGRDELTLTVKDGELFIQGGLVDGCNITLTTSSTVLTQILLLDATPETYMASGALKAEGNTELLKQLTDLFSL